MGEGRATQWGGSKRTIEQLLRLRAGDQPQATKGKRDAWDARAGISGRNDASDNQKAALLHSHTSFRALFAEVDDSSRVTDLVAAAWLGIATRTLTLGLKTAWPAMPPGWRTTLANLQVDPKPSQPALLNARFRWSFVRDVLPVKLEAQIARAEARRDRLLDGLAGVTEDPAYPGPVAERISFIVNAQGSVLHALGQGHVTASAFIAACDQGARLVVISPVEALSRPWVDPVARTAWEGPVAEALRVALSSAEETIAAGRAETERLRFELAMPGASRRRGPNPL